MQLQPRDVRDELGRAQEGAVLTDPAGDFIVRLSRAGWRNPGSRYQRGILQRVQYRLEDNVLYREYWPVMDRVLGMEPVSQELLAGVMKLEINFLDEANAWQETWPPRTERMVSPSSPTVAV